MGDTLWPKHKVQVSEWVWRGKKQCEDVSVVQQCVFCLKFSVDVNMLDVVLFLRCSCTCVFLTFFISLFVGMQVECRTELELLLVMNTHPCSSVCNTVRGSELHQISASVTNDCVLKPACRSLQIQLPVVSSLLTRVVSSLLTRVVSSLLTRVVFSLLTRVVSSLLTRVVFSLLTRVVPFPNCRPDQQVWDQRTAVLAHHSCSLVCQRPVLPLVFSHYHLRQLDPADVVCQHPGLRCVDLCFREGLPFPHKRWRLVRTDEQLTGWQVVGTDL